MDIEKIVAEAVHEFRAGNTDPYGGPYGEDDRFDKWLKWWRDYGFGEEEAYEWSNAGFEPQEAEELRDEGLTAEEAKLGVESSLEKEADEPEVTPQQLKLDLKVMESLVSDCIDIAEVLDNFNDLGFGDLDMDANFTLTTSMGSIMQLAYKWYGFFSG